MGWFVDYQLESVMHFGHRGRIFATLSVDDNARQLVSESQQFRVTPF
jgi:hypothetical protein